MGAADLAGLHKAFPWNELTVQAESIVCLQTPPLTSLECIVFIQPEFSLFEPPPPMSHPSLI